MRLYVQCQYCGHCWVEYLYDKAGVESLRCAKCKDSNIKQIKDEDRDPFGYHKD